MSSKKFSIIFGTWAGLGLRGADDGIRHSAFGIRVAEFKYRHSVFGIRHSSCRI